jgi:hypothetical protein
MNAKSQLKSNPLSSTKELLVAGLCTVFTTHFNCLYFTAPSGSETDSFSD